MSEGEGLFIYATVQVRLCDLVAPLVFILRKENVFSYIRHGKRKYQYNEDDFFI